MVQGSDDTTVELQWATAAEVEAAIHALTPAQLHRLDKYASSRAQGLAGLGLGISGTDLLQDAMARTYAGKRKWRKGTVSFQAHLIGVMRSCANHAPDELKGAKMIDGGGDDADDGGPPLSKSCTRAADSERLAAAHEMFEHIIRKFPDEETQLVIEGLSTEMTGPEIQQALGLTKTQYETIMTRLRRGIDRKVGWKP